MKNGDGSPFLITFQNNGSRFCYPVMLKDISDFDPFSNILEPNKYFDLETPYGYGGPLSDNAVEVNDQRLFMKEFKDYCNSNRIVSQFIRFSPWLSNYDLLNESVTIKYLKDTIYIDTSDADRIISNMVSKQRTAVRKALKCGVKIEKKGIDCINDFVEIYYETMERKKADEYYFFNESYFKTLYLLRKNAIIYYATFEKKYIGASIFFYNGQYMHYHLSGSKTEYMNLCPTNLIIYQAALDACENGIKLLHLGGGNSAEDSLFNFKKKFNKNGRIPFYVGRIIFDNNMYNELVSLRKKLDEGFDENNNFMIQYRRPAMKSQ